jgi:hypothetical protein
MYPSSRPKAFARWAVFRIHGLLSRRVWLVFAAGWVSSFIVSLLANRITDNETKSFWDVVEDLLVPAQGRPLPIVVYTSIGAVLLLLAAKWGAERLNAKWRPDVIFAGLLSRKRSTRLKDFLRGQLAWGEAVILQLCPDLAQPWPMDSVQFDMRGSWFALDHDDWEKYSAFMAANAGQRFAQIDGECVRLKQAPFAFTDSRRLILHVEKCRYSQFVFTSKVIATDESRWRCAMRAIEETDRQITFANSLCLHAVVKTSDSKVLMTQRSSAVDWYPGAWSASVEEQLHEADLHVPGVSGGLAWAHRLLKEELALEPKDYLPENLVVAAVMLEADVLNCAICAILTLSIDSHTLDAILSGKPREDYEFSRWEFIDEKDLTKELMEPSRRYHPTSALRMLLAALVRFGAQSVEERLAAGSILDL